MFAVWPSITSVTSHKYLSLVYRRNFTACEYLNKPYRSKGRSLSTLLSKGALICDILVIFCNVSQGFDYELFLTSGN